MKKRVQKSVPFPVWLSASLPDLESEHGQALLRLIRATKRQEVSLSKADYYYWMGRFLAEQGNTSRAHLSFRKSLRAGLMPESYFYLDAQKRLTLMDIEAGRFVEAFERIAGLIHDQLPSLDKLEFVTFLRHNSLLALYTNLPLDKQNSLVRAIARCLQGCCADLGLRQGQESSDFNKLVRKSVALFRKVREENDIVDSIYRLLEIRHEYPGLRAACDKEVARLTSLLTTPRFRHLCAEIIGTPESR